jgi:hypothetical protein
MNSSMKSICPDRIILVPVRIVVATPRRMMTLAACSILRQRFLCQASDPSEFSDPLSEFHLVEIHIFVLSACCGEQKIHSQDQDRSLSPEKGALKKGYRCRILKMYLSKPLAYVSSALNACQAFDILFVCICRGIREKEKGPRQEGVPFKRYGYPFRAGGLSSSVWLNLPVYISRY